MNPLKLLAAFFIAFCIAAPLRASIVLNWVDWTDPVDYPENSPAGAEFPYVYATGTTGSILMPNSSTVNVTLSGEIIGSYGASEFGSNTDYFWAGENYNGTTYISANVPTLPPNSDRIGLGGYGIPTQSLSFSAPVSNIVMNIWSLGNPSTLGSWIFNQPFVILSQNAGQYPAAPYALRSAANNTLNGYEGSGTLQFTGTFASLSWQVVNPEVYAVWNIGVTSASAAVPEPGTWAAAALLVGGAAFARWRKRRAFAKVVH